MEPSTSRPSTPPPRTGLLTPPSTRGACQQELFVRPQESHANSKRQLKNLVQGGETLSEFFDEYNEGSDVQVNDNSDAGSFPLDNSSTASTVSYKSDQTSAQKVSKFEYLGLGVTVPIAGEPFPFLKLPLSIRNKVYEYLLVIPAIICVRQKHTAYHDEREAYLYAERRELLSGIAYALAQTKVDGFKTRFSCFPATNLNILRSNKEVFAEARAVLYSLNDFEVTKPTNELIPQSDFSIPLFPPGYQRIVTKLNIRIRTFYDLHWLLTGSYNVMRNYYRDLSTLTLILEMDSATKGFGRRWARKKSENWVAYTKRLQSELAKDLFDGAQIKDRTIPTCLNLRVLFSGETYDGSSGALTDIAGIAMIDTVKVERTKREELRSALVES